MLSKGSENGGDEPGVVTPGPLGTTLGVKGLTTVPFSRHFSSYKEYIMYWSVSSMSVDAFAATRNDA